MIKSFIDEEPPLPEPHVGTEGDDVFSVDSEGLWDSTYDGLGGTDTLQLTGEGGGSFNLAAATLISIEKVLGTSEDDDLAINAQVLSGVSTIDGGAGENVLSLYGGETLDFQGKTITGFARLQVRTKQFDAIFDHKATAMSVWAQRSQNDMLTLVGDTFTEAEREQLHRQGVDTIVDDSGTYTNFTPRLHNLVQERVYTSGGMAYLDLGSDAHVESLDDQLGSLRISLDDFEDPNGSIDIVAQDLLTLPDGTEDGSSVFYDGVEIGVISRDGVILTIAFTGDATQAAVEALIHSLVYRNLDTDPSVIKKSYISLALSDEGGREVAANILVMAGAAGAQFLTPDADPSSPEGDPDVLLGTGDDDTFGTDTTGLGAGDVVVGGRGTDTLHLIDGGAFDIAALDTFSGVEIIKGSNLNEWIIITDAQLRDVKAIYGGDDAEGLLSDTLSIVGTSIDLRGKTFDSLEHIILLSDNAIVTVDDKAHAALVSSINSQNDYVILVGQTFTAEERASLFQRQIETISDASGTYTNGAPTLGNLSGDRSIGITGETIFIDAGRNATLAEESGRLGSLTVTVVDGGPSDRIEIATSDRVRLTQLDGYDRILVDGIDIGFIPLSEQGSGLEVTLGENATPQLVQELIRALTYRNTSDFAGQREIKVKVTDTTSDSTEASVVIGQEISAKPTDIRLSNAVVDELASNGATVGTLTGTDPNTGDVLTYQLLDDAGGRFMLDAGRLVVRQGIKLDYEQAQSHQVTVRATDKRGLFLDKTLTIGVKDVAQEIAIGSDEADVIFGGRGNDKLYGRLGNDVLKGGLGKDVFAFDSRLGSANVDTIRDFRVKDDTISIAKAIFTKIGRAGVLSEKAFWTGARAHDSSDRIIYNDKTGAIFYDPDGTGSARAVKFAAIAKNLDVTHRDFLII